MIKNWYVTGDKHGAHGWTKSINVPGEKSETGIIILGDAGCNFFLNSCDDAIKQEMQDGGYTFFLVRGNHEQRPELIDGFHKEMNEDANGVVYVEPRFPNIFYLMDGASYQFGPYTALVVGGAYSVDKGYRLAAAGLRADAPAHKLEKRAHWFPQEQLTAQEMDDILKAHTGKHYDFILTHTCPFSWMPIDLFLSGIDQSEVDNSMEKWMDDLKAQVHWGAWCFGHFHSDRMERPHVEMYYRDFENLDNIWNRWFYDGIKNEWWLVKSPQYYYDDNPYRWEV